MCAWVNLLRADVDDSAYDTASQRVPAEARRALESRLAQEKEQEIARERAESESAARVEAERLAVLAARPWPERATEQHCTRCHPASHYMNTTHDLPGWWAVALRMKVLNKAPIAWSDLPVVVRHLSARYPSKGIESMLEWLALAVLLFLPLLVIHFLHRLRKPQRRAKP